MREIKTFVKLTLFCLLMPVVAVSLFGMFAHTLEAKTWPVESIYEPMSELVGVTIIGDERGTLRQYNNYREDRYSPGSQACVEARKGERFQIRVENFSNGRVALVVSVDGLNIISGEKSNQSSKESMYVINPRQTGTFSGWRSGLSNVQRFYFTNGEDSYSSRLGINTQLGFIKVAVFRERQQIKYMTYDSELTAPGRRAESQKSMESGPGTGYGETSWSPVNETEFASEASAAQFAVIKYEWPSSLRYAPAPDNGHRKFAPAPPEETR